MLKQHAFFTKFYVVLIFINVILGSTLIATHHTSKDIAHLFSIKNPDAYEPETIEELQTLVRDAQIHDKKIALVGAGKSMGGQTVPPSLTDYRISLHKLNKLVNLNVKDKEVTIQAGMAWRQLQEYIVPHRLAIKAMQSYHDFAVGGSLSVNVHGQALQHAPIIGTVLSFTLLKPNGKIIKVSRTENQELFGLVIGGYGLFGIIVDVTLSLTDDVLLERKMKIIDSADLADYFIQNIRYNPNIEFYSARFLLSKPQTLKKALVITYEKSDNNNPELFAFTKTEGNRILKTFMWLTAKSDAMKRLRFFIEKKYIARPEIISRNNFANNTVESLPSHDDKSQYILQEYFIPYAHLNAFMDSLRSAIAKHDINMLNITARHVHRDVESKLSFAQQECCALVLYISLTRTSDEYSKAMQWTQELIDAACACNGTYYLPYQLLATQTQLELAYPAFKEFVALKKQYDPQEMFINKLYQKYGQAIAPNTFIRSRL